MDVVQNAEDYPLTLSETSSLTATNAENSFPWNKELGGFSAESAFLVSYSEIQSYRQCQRRHYYSFFRKYQPAIQSGPIQLGNLGHKLLEIYYESRDNPDTSLTEILEHIATYYTEQYMTLIENHVRGSTLVGVYERVLDYITHDPFRRYDILDVEKTFVTPLTNEIGLAFTPDLVIQSRETGVVKVVDHKFVGKQWNSARLMMTTQLDVYAAALQYHNIYPVKKIYNFMGTTAPLLNPLEEFSLNEYKAVRILDELQRYAEKIYSMSLTESDFQDRFATRILDPTVCQWCPFLDLCYGELTGNEKVIERAENLLIPNTYGYRKE